METSTLNRTQVIALMMQISAMAARAILALECRNKREFARAIAQLDAAGSVVGDIVEFPADAVARE